jgi:hypothetical protein
MRPLSLLLVLATGCATLPVLPNPDGPCIQLTRKRLAWTQYWMNSWPLADSDVNPVLMGEAKSRSVARRGMVRRGVGYALFGVGVLSIPLLAAAMVQTHHDDLTPYMALPGVAIAGTGAGLIVEGWRDTERSIARYNEVASATGRCVAPGQDVSDGEEIIAEQSLPPKLPGPPLHASQPMHDETTPLNSASASVETTGLVAQPSAQEACGVTVVVQPVTHVDLKSRTSLTQRIEWSEADMRMARGSEYAALGKSTSEPMVQTHRTSGVQLMPLPAIAMRIENRSGHAVRFADVAVALEDGDGNRYPAFTTEGGLWHRVQVEFIRRHPYAADSLATRDVIRQMVEQLPVLLPQIEIGDGEDWTGYVGFRIALRDAGEVESYLTRVKGLRLVISNLEGQTLSFALNPTPARVDVICPGGVAPSLRACVVEPLR